MLDEKAWLEIDIHSQVHTEGVKWVWGQGFDQYSSQNL